MTRVGRFPLALAALAALALAASALVRRAGTPAGDAIRSVAVLPFENTSGDTSYAYLEDGLADHVRDALSAAPALTVKARGSSRQLKGKGAREVGHREAVLVEPHQQPARALDQDEVALAVEPQRQVVEGDRDPRRAPAAPRGGGW